MLQNSYSDKHNVVTHEKINVDNFGIVGKVSNDGAVGRLWRHEKC